MSASLTQARILVIDDFQGMRTMLRDFLRAMGVTKVDTASNGREAISQLRNARYDIVICDFNLGLGQNGQQVLDEARMHDLVGVSTIWVMVTAEKTTDMVMGTAEVKPDDYLLKPINQKLLESRLEKLIQRKLTLRGIEEAIKGKDFMAAIHQCDQQLKAPGTANPQEILRIKSDLLLTVGDYGAATTLFESVLAARSVPWARTGLGKIAFHNGQYAEARDIFQQVLADNRMFMEASDWLVKTLDAMGAAEQAQQVLLEAVKLSPNSATRQKALGDTALRNGSLEVAQAAFEKTIKISEFSPHKSASAFTGLAKVLTGQGTPEEALKVLAKGRQAFRDSPEAAIQTAAAEGVIYQKLGDTEKAKAALDQVQQMMTTLPSKVGPEAALDLAQSLLAMGQKDQACDLMRDLVKNNHENAALSRQVEAVFDDAQLGEVGRSLVQQSQQEVVAINNQGVTLAKQGQYLEGAKLLRTAVQNLPNSEVVIMNLCGLLIGLMHQEGRSEALVREVRDLLDRVAHINPANKKYHLYLDAINRGQ